MITTEDQDRRGDKKSELLEQLRNPTQLRLLLTIIVLGIGYAAIYLPLNGGIIAGDPQVRRFAKAAEFGRRRRTIAETVSAGGKTLAETGRCG